jgi:uncharacterized protein YdhG (YjbR/CyaY superfamily)
MTLNPVDEYIAQFEGVKKEWLQTFVAFMREHFPGAEEKISYQMPMFKFGKQFIGFSVAQDHFSFHTVDFEMVEALKALLPKAKFGKGCAKVKYGDKAAIPVLFDMAKRIVERSKAGASKGTR